MKFEKPNLDSEIIIKLNDRKQFFELCEFARCMKFDLLYRARRDGFQASDFHAKCDSKPNTITIVKTSDGYTYLADLRMSVGLRRQKMEFTAILTINMRFCSVWSTISVESRSWAEFAILAMRFVVENRMVPYLDAVLRLALEWIKSTLLIELRIDL